MNKFLVLLFLIGSVSFSFGQSTQIIQENATKDVQKFTSMVQGDIPALALSNEQVSKIEDIFISKHTAAAKLDPYKVGKLNAQRSLMDLEKNAIIEAMAVLTMEQKLAYRKNIEKR